MGDNKKQTKSQWLSDFAASTSIHGISDVQGSGSTCGKLFWVAVILCFFGLAIMFVVVEILDFLHATVETTVSTKDVSSLNLPNVGICYFYGMNVTKLREEGFTDPQFLRDVSAPHPLLQFNTTILEKHDTAVKAYMKTNGLTDPMEFFERFAYICPPVPPVIRYVFSFNLHDYCAMTKNRSLSWRFQYSYAYNCFGTRLGNQTRPGISDGKVLYVEKPKDEVRKELKLENTGFTVQLFPGKYPDKLDPLLFDYGYMIQISIQLQIVNRLRKLSFPKSDDLCEERVQFGPNCQDTGLSQKFASACGCQVLGYMPPENYTSPDEKMCTPFRTNICAMTNLADLGNWTAEVSESCKPACSEQKFLPQITMTHQAHGAFRNKEGRECSTLLIGYPHLNVKKMEQHDAYTMTALLSSVGGQLGLWLGCSFISIVQALVLCTRCQRKKNIADAEA